MAEIKFKLPNTIRVKLNTSCQYKCKFCHQEGDVESGDINHLELASALRFFKDDLEIKRVHFTGGEPILYGDFINILKDCKQNSLDCALTTNGQFDINKLPELIKAGLGSINFSLHAMDVYSFLKTQNFNGQIKEASVWANDCLQRTLQNIIIANTMLPTKVNCVVGSEFISSEEVLHFCIKNNLKLRLLNSLELGKEAVDNIERLIKKNDATMDGHEVTFLSSSHRLDYKIGSYEFGVKCIRSFYLQSICQDCDLRKQGKCLECFYGLRLEGSPLKVRLCLSKNEKPFVQSFDEFIKSKEYQEIKDIYNSVKNYLCHDAS